MIRAYYEDSDRRQVRDIYDLARPDEMRGNVDADKITPLAQDGQIQNEAASRKQSQATARRVCRPRC
jgi:hypothetical protein